MFDYILIGSGPSSIISATELVKANKKVCILDYGKKIDTSIKNQINQRKTIERTFR
jgi:choline dehydrogenase-like flavoprotein